MRRTIEQLEHRLLLATWSPVESSTTQGAITVLTHGYQLDESFPDWILTMGQAILDRADGPRTDRMIGSIYQHDSAGGAWQPVAGDIWQSSNQSDEHIVLLFDWATESNNNEDGWLEAAADALFASLMQNNDNLGGDLTDRSFFDVACGEWPLCTNLDLHFIGHSRGAVLNSLVTERFGHQFPGLMIDQVTSLDPHPASPMDDFGYVSNNPNANSRLFTFENVAFADNYFRQDGFYELDLDFNGVRAEGAYNLQIPESVLSGAGSFFEHSDVHTWYYGTITEPFDSTYAGYNGSGRNDDGDVSFPESWYGVTGVPPRDLVGFHFSTIASGDRTQLPAEFQFIGSSLAPRSLVTVFNGDLHLGSSGEPEIPGWTYHAGNGTANIRGNERYLELQAGGDESFRGHTTQYFPPRADGVEFDYWIHDADQHLNDELQILVAGCIIDTIPLNTLTSGFHRDYRSLLGFHQAGLAESLEFLIRDTAGDGIDAGIRIDNVQLTTRSPVIGDFNEDGDLDCDDIDLLTAAIAAGNTNAIFDLNGDQAVDLSDLDAWLALAGAAQLPSGQPYLPGDANLDGLVDGSDFNIWNSNKFTVDSRWCGGDFNADGVTDRADFGIWNTNKFQSSLVPPRVAGGTLWAR